jgi:hypothetical protein
MSREILVVCRSAPALPLYLTKGQSPDITAGAVIYISIQPMPIIYEVQIKSLCPPEGFLRVEAHDEDEAADLTRTFLTSGSPDDFAKAFRVLHMPFEDAIGCGQYEVVSVTPVEILPGDFPTLKRGDIEKLETSVDHGGRTQRSDGYHLPRQASFKSPSRQFDEKRANRRCDCQRRNRPVGPTPRLPANSFPPLEELDRQVESLREELRLVRREGAVAKIRSATARTTRAVMRAQKARLIHGESHLERQMQGIRIGPVALISIQDEPFVEIGQRIAAESPFAHTLFSGYSNGNSSYLPVRHAFEEGGYEISVSLYCRVRYCPSAPRWIMY